MAASAANGFPILDWNEQREVAESQFANAVIATDPNPNTALLTTQDIRLAIEEQFQSPQVIPLTITRFRSEFVIQFATRDERDIVASSEVLWGHNFDMLLTTWNNRHGGRVIDWDTAVTIDITGFPPHAFDPAALGPLLSHHCSVQAYSFCKSKGICRVDAYTLNTRSIPQSGHMGLQYPKKHGVSNVVFPVTMKTYLFSQAPDLEEETDEHHYPISPAGSEASFDIAEELGYDREVLEETYAWQHRANMRLERARYHGHASDSDSSCYTISSDEPFYLPRDYSPACSFESDRSWKLY